MARSRPPSFDFYPEDFLAGTMHLHPLCIGIYIRLLCFQWSHGKIPNERRQLLQITGALPEELEQHLSQVLEKFDLCDDGFYRNARLERERQRKMSISEARANAAHAKWALRPGPDDAQPSDANASASAYANMDAKGMPPIRKLEVGSRKTEEGVLGGGVGEPAPSSWEIPESLDTPEVRDLLSEFAAMRRKIGKPIKDLRNSSKVLKHFDSVEHLVFALETCIGNEYQGLKPDYRPEGRSSGAKVRTVVGPGQRYRGP